MPLRDLLDSNVFQPANLVRLAVAVGIASLVWIGVQAVLSGPDEPTPAPPAATAQPPAATAPSAATEPQPVEPPPDPPVYPKVLVSKRDIQSGVVLVAELVEWKEWRDPIDDLNLVVLQDAVPLQAILGSVTQTPYEAGEPFAWDGIIVPGGPGFISAVLEPHMRAVTIEVDRATMRANIIYPGDRVDVIMVGEADEERGPVSQTIISDVRVLAVGSTIVSLSRYGRASVTNVGTIEPVRPPAGENYTLEVFPEDAERIALAVSRGQLTLAMRNATAPPPYVEEPQRLVRLQEVLVEPNGAPPSEDGTVRVIRGNAEEVSVVVGS